MLNATYDCNFRALPIILFVQITCYILASYKQQGRNLFYLRHSLVRVTWVHCWILPCIYIYICTVIQTRQLTASLENSGDHHVPTCARSGSPCVASTTNCKGRTQTLRSKQSSSRSILWWEQGPRVLFLPQITCLCRRSKWRLLHNDGFESHLILRQTCCSFLSICAGLNHNS